jgi:hypothetical protein
LQSKSLTIPFAQGAAMPDISRSGSGFFMERKAAAKESKKWNYSAPLI